jgi:hypothetical protein
VANFAFGSANAWLIVHGREQASTEAAICNDETPLNDVPK